MTGYDTESALLAAVNAQDWNAFEQAAQELNATEWNNWVARYKGGHTRGLTGQSPGQSPGLQSPTTPTPPERPRQPGPGVSTSTPLTENNPLSQMLRRIGVTGALSGTAPSVNDATGAYLSGPNPIITSPFRHLFNQGQIDSYALREPMPVTTLTPDGKYKTQSYDWWNPSAVLQNTVAALNGDDSKKKKTNNE